MSHSFNDYWITETLRLRESLWGPLADAAEAGKARTLDTGFAGRVIYRARLLAKREQLDDVVLRWQQIARLLLWCFVAASILAGITAAVAALGNGARPVNLALAVAGLLGLNLLTLLLWLFSFGVQGGTSGTLLADAWLALTRRLARGPDAALAPRALLELLSRHQLTRWSAGALSHGLWLLAMLACLSTLMVLLSVRSYAFQWETTLLSPDTYVAVVQGLGRLPGLLGFPVPDPQTIRASDGVQALPPGAYAVWSGWLLGVVVVYGLIPRLIALMVSGIMVRHRAARVQLDASLPGIAELHDRLMPQRVLTGIDSPEPDAQTSQVPAPLNHLGTGAVAMVGVELPSDLTWPPRPLHEGTVDLGVIDTREQRRHVLEALRRSPASRLLAACDARQTPDRGTLALLAELASLADTFHVLLLPEGETATRRRQWREQLLKGGLALDELHGHGDTALNWLAGKSAGEAAVPAAGRGTYVDKAQP